MRTRAAGGALATVRNGGLDSWVVDVGSHGTGNRLTLSRSWAAGTANGEKREKCWTSATIQRSNWSKNGLWKVHLPAAGCQPAPWTVFGSSPGSREFGS